MPPLLFVLGNKRIMLINLLRHEINFNNSKKKVIWIIKLVLNQMIWFQTIPNPAIQQNHFNRSNNKINIRNKNFKKWREIIIKDFRAFLPWEFLKRELLKIIINIFRIKRSNYKKVSTMILSNQIINPEIIWDIVPVKVNIKEVAGTLKM